MAINEIRYEITVSTVIAYYVAIGWFTDKVDGVSEVIVCGFPVMYVIVAILIYFEACAMNWVSSPTISFIDSNLYNFEIFHPPYKMSGNSKVGNSQIYETGDQVI